MQISLGDYQYRVRFTDQKLYLNREAVLSICDHPQQEVIVDARATAEQVRQIVLEAMARIWDYRFGQDSALVLAAAGSAGAGGLDSDESDQLRHSAW